LQDLVGAVLEAGRSAVELTLYVLLPVMVVMMAVMRLLEAKGVLAFVARFLTPVLRPFGIPGIGVFAMLQLLLVSFAAPAATLTMMETAGNSRREIGATLAMILAMSQANAVFPLLAVGLNLPVTLLTSLVGGFTASAVTYYVFLRSGEERSPQPREDDPKPAGPTGFLALLSKGGQEGVQLSIESIPMLVLALCLVKALAAAGAIVLLERSLAPAFASLGLPGAAVLPIATKYLAGGTAMMGVMINLVHSGALSALDLNRVAGFMINPLDLVGVPYLLAARPQVRAVALEAMAGAAVGILIRGLLHLILF
jgi:spore maturation protein SpmB